MTSRRSRGTRLAPSGRLRLQQRDLAVLRFTGRAGVVELATVAPLFWGTGPGAMVAAARRFRLLTDHGLIRTWASEVSHPNRYSLTDSGVTWAADADDDGRVFRTRVRAYSQAADHIVATARAWAALAVRLSAPGSPRLVRFVTEGELRRLVRVRRGALIPDAIAVVGEAAPKVIALEVDFANERAEVFATKLAKYRGYASTGTTLFGLNIDAILILAPGTRRLATLAIMACEQELDGLVFFQDMERLSPDSVIDGVASVSTLTEAARTGSDPFSHSLMEVLACA